MKNVDKFHLFYSVGPDTRFITRFAVCLSGKVYECLWSLEATGTAWIDLEQNFIDTAFNEWRKCLFACIRIVGQQFKQFYYRQLKNGQLNKMWARVSEIWTKCVLRVMLIKQSYRIG